MKNSLFNPENWLWQPFGKVADFLILSGLWLFSCIPIVTIGSSLTALYDCSAHCIKDGDKGMFSRYFRTLKRELIPSLISFLLWTSVIGGTYLLIRSFTSNADSTTWNLVIAYASIFILVFEVGIASWVFPLLSRFTFSVVDLNSTAIRIALANLPRTIALGVCTSLTIWICLHFWIPLLAAPGICGFIATYLLEPVFSKYDGRQEAENETDGDITQ